MSSPSLPTTFTNTPYLDTIHVKSGGLAGPMEYTQTWEEVAHSHPLLKVWLEENDWQQITVASTNLGIWKRYTKQYK